MPVGALVNTSSVTTIVVGLNTVVVASLTNILPGMFLNVANGTGTAEDVQVTSVNVVTSSFTAVFRFTHSGAYTIISLKGTNLGSICVGTPGSGVVITVYDGHPSLLPTAGSVISVISPTGGGNYGYSCVADRGLWYTVTAATTMGDITFNYMDQPA